MSMKPRQGLPNKNSRRWATRPLSLVGILAICLSLGSLQVMGKPSTLQKLWRLCVGGEEEEPARPTFKFGVACAAYQVEGAAAEGGRTPSIWDTFSHTKGKTDKGDTGDTACDFYHRYKEDIALLKGLGVKIFRFSISWTRLLPDGRGNVNAEGLRFYNSLIDELIAAGMEPHVTLYHWDFPQILEDEYQGWLSERSIPDFVHYAATAFGAFGDRVVHWTTFNEPWTFIFLGYDRGIHAPGRCSDRSTCKHGDSTKEPWVVTHNVLSAHAAAVKEFRRRLPHGRISLNLNSDWAEPLTSSKKDQAAAQRHLDFSLGVFADPIFLGDYPQSVRERVGKNLPTFTDEQRSMLKGSVDYFALNHYTSKYVANSKEPFSLEGTEVSDERHGRLIGPQADSDWLNVVPWGFGKLLLYVQSRYGDPEIFITESGVDVPRETKMSLKDALHDEFRIKYFKGYLREAMNVVTNNKVKIRGYCAWSCLDNFEWADGYAKRFGVIYTDYGTMERHIKDSARWLSKYFAVSEADVETN